MARTPFLFNNHFCMQGWGRRGLESEYFFCQKFMKNKETTAGHYNLLPNQGHAVSIVMKLYKKFTGPESV